MRDSAEHHNDVIEVLSEFIRNRAPRARRSDHQVWMHPVTGSDLPAEPAPDIQAALTALGHRPSRPERQRIDLAGLHLAGALLERANLTRADLTGADLTGAHLDFAHLIDTQLHGADLTGASLWVVNLTDAYLIGANLTRAKLWSAILTDAYLTDADLTGAELYDADLTDAHLLNADLTDAKGLGGAILTGALWPSEAAVPKGWERVPARWLHPGGELKRSSTSQDGQGHKD